MYSSFFGLNVGQQGLFTARTALNVTNHNLSNIDTKGFSRQYHIQRATDPMANARRGMIGTGVEVTGVERYRDVYLDNKYWGMSATKGQYEVKTKLMAQLEVIMNEPNDVGLSKHYDNIFTSLETLSKDPDDKTCRRDFLKKLNSFASYINDMGTKLMDVQKDANFGITNVVNKVNHIAEELSLLNYQITSIEKDGNVANDLRDERDRQIDELSKIVNTKVKTYKDEYGKEHYRVTINNQLLVRDGMANYLETRPRKYENNPEDSLDMLDIYWKTGQEFYVDSINLSGELKGYIDVRDGNNKEHFKANSAIESDGFTLRASNVSRTDLKEYGELRISNGDTAKFIAYHGYEYDEVSGEIRFDIGFPDSAAGKEVFARNLDGDLVRGVVQSGASKKSLQVKWDDPNVVLSSVRELQIDSQIYKYTEPATTVSSGVTEFTISVDSSFNKVRQGDNLDYKGVSHYLKELNEFVRVIADKFNSINEKGRQGGKNGNPLREPLFVFKGYEDGGLLSSGAHGSKHVYEKINCLNFRVNPKILDGDEGLKLLENTTKLGDYDSDNELMLDMLKIRHDSTAFGEKGKPEHFIEGMIGEVGIDSKDCQEIDKGQGNLLHLVNNRRLSVSGVEINEEVNNLMKYQQAYSVAAKIISVMDEIYDVTINRMGL